MKKVEQNAELEWRDTKSKIAAQYIVKQDRRSP